MQYFLQKKKWEKNLKFLKFWAKKLLIFEILSKKIVNFFIDFL